MSAAKNLRDDDHAALEALRERIRELVARFPTRARAAQVAGISPQQLHNLVSGRNKPSLLPMARLTAAAGESMDWLVRGSRSPPTAVDQELLGWVIDDLARVYREEGIEPAAGELGQVAAREYTAAAAAAALDEQHLTTHLTTERLRLVLRAEDPGSRVRVKYGSS